MSHYMCNETQYTPIYQLQLFEKVVIRRSLFSTNHFVSVFATEN